MFLTNVWPKTLLLIAKARNKKNFFIFVNVIKNNVIKNAFFWLEEFHIVAFEFREQEVGEA